ncbi:MAG TPA: hypothetical protein VKV95_03575 [Terriglobia bacterium]|nr:hypothetical protein [Terriglobia bacterium]
MTFPTGKCPNCQDVIPHVEVEAISIEKILNGRWNGISYLCPSCRTILGVQIDPVALQVDTVKEILEALGKS